MGAFLNLEDVVAGYPKARAELDELRARIANLEAILGKVLAKFEEAIDESGWGWEPVIDKAKEILNHK